MWECASNIQRCWRRLFIKCGKMIFNNKFINKPIAKRDSVLHGIDKCKTTLCYVHIMCVKGMFFYFRKGLTWLDRGNDRCMHYHDIDIQWMEVLGKIYKHEANYLHGARIMSKVTRHQWCRLGFCREDCVTYSKVLVILVSVGRGC